MFKEIFAKCLALKVKVVEAVQFVEREFAGKSGKEKRAAAIRIIDDFVQLPAYLEWADNIVIGWLIDLAVEKFNWASDWMYGKTETPEVDVEKVAAVLTANQATMARAKAAAKDTDVNSRIEELYRLYDIKPDEPEEKPAETVKPVPAPVPVPEVSDAAKNWEKSISFVGLAEGGRNFEVVNGKPVLKASAKNDRGGPTAYGITQAALNTAYAGKIVGHNDIVKLTRDEAKRIYKANYWDCYGWGELAWPVCLVLFDITVNHGMSGTAKIAQRACTSYGYQPALAVDGKWGPKTKAAVWSVAAKNPAELTRLLLLKRKEYYDGIIAANKSQEVYRNGWYNRIRNLAKTVGVASPV